jgi:glycosyltransferase involved in cell wall biosynthesis
MTAPHPLPRLPQNTAQPALADSVDIAVLVPCYNEESAIAAVVAGFRAALPHARVYVYDNNSRDNTAEIARAAGAIVRHERLQGKGHVVARMFADIEADAYILVDGDDTYDAADAPRLVNHLLDNRLDLVNAARNGTHERPGHRFGNDLFNRITAWMFGSRFEDMLSGYKVLSRRFVKSFPALATGFEIETELVVHALRLRMPVAELPSSYGRRAEGSASKLRTGPDGLRILWAIFRLVKGERPLAFFFGVFALLAALSVAFGAPVVATYLETGLVPRLPTAVLSTGLIVLAFLSLAAGFILDTVTRGRTEMKRLHYLSLHAPREGSCKILRSRELL